MVDDRKILIVSDNRNVRRYITRSLASAGYRPDHTLWDQATLENVARPTLDMCILDANGKRAEIVWLLRHMYENCPNVICLLVSHDCVDEAIRDLIVNGHLNNLIAKHGGVSASDDIIDESELIVTCQKLFRRDIFGIDKYLTTWSVKIHEREILGTGDKSAAIDELSEYLDLIDCYGAIKHSVLLVADELIMNAIYNAPRDKDGQPKYAYRDRRQGLVLEPDERAMFRYACDGKHIALSITDPFGSLDRDVILHYIERSFDSQPAEVKDKQGGAGLGLYMVFSSITQLTFNIEVNKATEVIAMFYVRRGGRAFRASGRSLNIFLLQ